jgi:hypothetical protein
MANTNTLSIYLADATTQAYLRNVIAGIFENYQKTSVSAKLKSKNANLTQKAGSYEFKRFANSTVREYGTARTANKGDKVIAPPVVVNLDKNKEIVEEVNFFDADGSFTDESFQGFVNKRKINFELSLADWLDLEFFSEIKTSGTAATTLKDATGAAIADIDLTKKLRTQLEAVIGAVEKTGKDGTENKYVRGVDRRFMALVLDSRLYGLIKDELNDCYNFAGNTADEVFPGLNGVAVFSTVNLPDGCDYQLVTMDSVAQPVIEKGFDFEKIPLSNDYAMEMFFRYGTKALAPELAVWGKIKTA